MMSRVQCGTTRASATRAAVGHQAHQHARRAAAGAGERAGRGRPVAAHGQVQGRGAAPHAEASESVRPEEVARSERRSRASAVPRPAAAAPVPRGTTRSTKKKPRSTWRRSWPSGARCAARRQHDYAATRSGACSRLDARTSGRRPRPRAKLCGEAVQAASGIISDILQGLECGVCVGMATSSASRRTSSGPASRVQCAHCDNTVDVVESIAFSGKLGKCPECATRGAWSASRRTLPSRRRGFAAHPQKLQAVQTFNKVRNSSHTRCSDRETHTHCLPLQLVQSQLNVVAARLAVAHDALRPHAVHHGHAQRLKRRAAVG